MKKQLEKWIRKNYGKRCTEFEATCANCRAWTCYDFLIKFTSEKNDWNLIDDIPKILVMMNEAAEQLNIFKNKKNKELANKLVGYTKKISPAIKLLRKEDKQ